MNNPRNKLIDDLDELDGTQYDDTIELEEDTGDEAADEGTSGTGDNVPSDNVPADNPDESHPVDQTSPTGQQDKPGEKEQFQANRGGYHTDSKGNIVDPRDGTIIAKAGSERRLYEKNVRIQSQMTEVVQERDKYKNYVNTAGNLANEIQKHNFTPTELQEYMDTVVLYKSNPLEAAKRIVANVAAMGYNVSEIVGGTVGDAIDLKAVKRMLDDQLAPLRNEKQQVTQQEQQINEYNKWLDNFVEKNEHADVHLPVLDRMVGNNPALDAQSAYYELKLFCTKNGFDFTKPLQPQVNARKAASAQPQQPATQQRAQSRTPFSQRSTAPNTTRAVDEADVAPGSASWDDIIRSTMRPR